MDADTDLTEMRIIQPLRPGEMHQASSLRLILAAFLLIPLASCRVSSQSVVKSQETHDFQRLEIIYRAHPAAGPLFSPSSSGVVQAGAKVNSDPFQGMTWSKAELRIECPHPDGRADMAKVTLHFRPVECGEEYDRRSWGERREDRAESRLSRRSTFRERCLYADPQQTNGEVITELDLPKSELDAILHELNSHGFFNDGQSAESESHLEVRLNRHWTSRRWGYEPSLDALTTRVYQEGTRRESSPANPPPKGEPANRFAWLKPFNRVDDRLP